MAAYNYKCGHDYTTKDYRYRNNYSYEMVQTHYCEIQMPYKYLYHYETNLYGI